MPQVTVKRDSGYADSLRRYKILLDDELVGMLAPGEAQLYEVAPGDHTMKFKIDWAATPAVSFRVGEEPVAFECFSKLRGPRLLYALLALFSPRGWIGIRKLEVPNQVKQRTAARRLGLQ